MGERITTERARELLAGATPGRWVWNMADNGCLTPPDDCSPPSSVAGIVPLGGLARDHYSGPYILEGSEWNGDRWTWARPADAALIAAAPDLAADLIDARDQIAALTAAQGVPVEAHARAVRNMLIGVSAAYRFGTRCTREESEWVAHAAWQGSADRRDLIAVLDACGIGPEHAAALADGAAGVPDAQAVAMVDGEVTP